MTERAEVMRLAARLHALRSKMFCWVANGGVSPACRPNAVRHQLQAEAILDLMRSGS